MTEGAQKGRHRQYSLDWDKFHKTAMAISVGGGKGGHTSEFVWNKGLGTGTGCCSDVQIKPGVPEPEHETG